MIPIRLSHLYSCLLGQVHQDLGWVRVLFAGEATDRFDGGKSIRAAIDSFLIGWMNPNYLIERGKYRVHLSPT